MAIKMVRQPSETPNINNVDDFIPFRYAYGDQNGYVQDKGMKVGFEIIGNTFRIKSGRVVIQGVEIDIDSNGYDVVVDNISEKRYHIVYLEVNLTSMSVSIKELADGAGFPFIEESDDLTANSSGIARLILYGFESYQGVISGIVKSIKPIAYSGTALVGYDISKGTVEERLTNLGFREGSVILANGVTATQNVLTRQGNYVLGHLILNVSDLTGGATAFTIPDGFKIKSSDGVTGFVIPFAEGNNIQGTRYAGTFTQKYEYNELTNDFYIGWFIKDSNAGDTNLEIKFGYEAEPLKTNRR